MFSLLGILSIMDLDVNFPTRFRNFSVIISLNKLSNIFTFPVPSVAFKMPILCLWWVSLSHIGILYSSQFFSFIFLNFKLFVFKFNHSLFFLIKSAVEALYWIFHHSHCILQSQEFLPCSFYSFHFFVELLILLFSWFPFTGHLLLWLKDSLI